MVVSTAQVACIFINLEEAKRWTASNGAHIELVFGEKAGLRGNNAPGEVGSSFNNPKRQEVCLVLPSDIAQNVGLQKLLSNVQPP